MDPQPPKPNWGTLFRQQSRLPIAANPSLDAFKCARFACTLSKTQCKNRYGLAQGSTRFGLTDQAVTYGACRRCPVGAAHKRGEPTPENQFEEDPMQMKPETDAAVPKVYDQRKCRGCKFLFQPTNATERACPMCRSVRAETGKPPGKGVKGKPTRDPETRTLEIRKPGVQVPMPIPVLEPIQQSVISPAELLTLAGFNVRTINTPRGVLLQVQ